MSGNAAFVVVGLVAIIAAAVLGVAGIRATVEIVRVRSGAKTGERP